MLTRDVCILGGGNAGLSLALQLRARLPESSITVLEHRGFPVPHAAHKVGESTVEIAAHYLAEELGLREHLERDHLHKFGLRFFFAGDRRPDDMAEYDELGPSHSLPVATYQLDRGILENHLANLARQRGIELLDRATVRSVDLAAGRHRVGYVHGDQSRRLVSRFLVDASGRRAWLRKQQGVERPTRHGNGAAWFRVAAEIDVDQWSRSSEWLSRCHGKSRRLSTNHFMGPGYWVWVIPLASRASSIGVVFDPALVDASAVSTHAGLSRWLAAEQPLLAHALEGAEVMDFHVMHRYPAGASGIYSDDGWMLCGDAAVFADPFYSPGGDFIAIGNTFITELIAGATRSGGRTVSYQRYLLSFFSNTLSLYRGLYGGFGHRDLMVLKIAWDYAYYWAVLAKLFFSRRMVDVAFMSDVQPYLVRAAGLNAGMQTQFRRLSRRGIRQGGEGGFVDHHDVPWFHGLKKELVTDGADRTAASLVTSIDRLGQLAAGITDLLPRVADGRALPPLAQVAGLG